MINNEKVLEILKQYKVVFSARWGGEQYKWIMIKHFQDNWDINAENFGEMFRRATDKTYNLLASQNNFPKRMIERYADYDCETVRSMFINLYDESKDVVGRILRFQSEAEDLCKKYTPGLQHFQKPMAISVYLWLRYPDKYYIYKYSVCHAFAMELISEFIPKKGDTARNILGNIKMFDEVTEAVAQDIELTDLFKSKLTSDCYMDDSYRTLAFDIGVYVASSQTDKAKEDVFVHPSHEQREKLEEMLLPVYEDDTEITTEEYGKTDFLEQVYMAEEDYDTLVNLLQYKKNLIIQGAPGVGKTFTARRLAWSIMKEKDENRIEFVQFHQNYSYEDFVMGYKPSGDSFELQNGIFYRFCTKAASNPKKRYFFIIDEINRGNMSKIFGELLMLIEKEYRGTKTTLAYSGLPFSVPENLYMIGMMNTADRSLAMIDYALRRRFSFFEMEPGFLSDGFQRYQNDFDNETFNLLIRNIVELNLEISKDNSLGPGFCIGHSYFCGQRECTDEWMKSVVEYDVIPMLTEYWFDEPAKLDKWKTQLRRVFDD